ncbi:C-type lectin domain family 6 member A-like [Branchiostoma lanceolatum]|uniref:C-type lectin domain family 6 member A-like n=1 Tax=Branchiostoma lanceolatum TaxID=7740 RepID=UPI0034550E2A
MTRKDHTSAQQTCEADGGHLAVVKTEFVKNFIAALIVDIENYWIGLNDKDTEGNWMWADGTTLSSSGFATGHRLNQIMTLSKTAFS